MRQNIYLAQEQTDVRLLSKLPSIQIAVENPANKHSRRYVHPIDNPLSLEPPPPGSTPSPLAAIHPPPHCPYNFWVDRILAVGTSKLTSQHLDSRMSTAAWAFLENWPCMPRMSAAVSARSFADDSPPTDPVINTRTTKSVVRESHISKVTQRGTTACFPLRMGGL